jgi:hypothetical protein
MSIMNNISRFVSLLYKQVLTNMASLLVVGARYTKAAALNQASFVALPNASKRNLASLAHIPNRALIASPVESALCSALHRQVNEAIVSFEPNEQVVWRATNDTR